MRSSRFFLFVFIVIAAVGIFLVIDGKILKGTAEKGTVSTESVIDEAFSLIQKRAVYPVNEDKLVEGALRGMADVIGDPYSTYFTEEEAAAHKESLAAERVGIGAEITRTNGKYIIVGPVKSSPAEKAGLLPYDEIVRIDGERLDNDSLKDVVQRIRGKKGTTVVMTIFRPDLGKHIDISIMREVISMKTVSSKMIEDDERKVGYISITTFAMETAKEWQSATNELISKGAQGLIVDVRGNPGGYLHSVGDIASSLLQEDTVFAFMQDAKGTLTPLVAEPSEELVFDEKLKNIPIVLLQDKSSASASEVLSGALQDLKRGYIVGTGSFGKGTVQDTNELSNGGEMKLSTAKWLTPKETWIHGKGVPADLEVEQSELFNEHIRLVSEEFKVGDFNEDVAYGQRMLLELGYTINREDGYFDESTAREVAAFREDAKVKVDSVMDRKFYTALKDQVEAYRNDPANDDQLQMGIGYMNHAISNK
ncbi:S41 family peptidase [Sporosarcina sp. CAU 1771]